MEVNKINESGRSMVETLGVLAIVGILSVGGVVMYRTAMNKHRANELLNEASKRATVVAAQITMQGKDAADATISEFTNPTGYTFDVAKVNDNQFKITINAVEEDICKQMKAAVETNTVVREIGTDCTYLTYNNDMSTTAYPSDYNKDTSGQSCQGAGYKWCSGSNTCVAAGADCTCSGEVGECQKCDPATGTLTVDEGKQCGNNTHKACNASGQCVWDLNTIIGPKTPVDSFPSDEACGCKLIGDETVQTLLAGGFIYDPTPYLEWSASGKILWISQPSTPSQIKHNFNTETLQKSYVNYDMFGDGKGYGGPSFPCLCDPDVE